MACGVFFVMALTMKVRMVRRDIYEKAKEEHGNVLLALWHGRQFLPVLTHRYRRILAMTSYSDDGKIQTAIFSKLGYVCVRGSAGKRGAVQGTIRMIEKLRQGHDAAFTVDGPAGPGFEPKHGILYIARKTGLPVVPMSASAKKKKVFDNWDRYLLPYPFSRGVVVYGEPVTVGKDDDLQEKAELLKKRLNELSEEADRLMD